MKKKLENYAIDIFKKMNIEDDKTHCIELKKEYYADLVINSSALTTKQIYDIIKKYIVK